MIGSNRQGPHQRNSGVETASGTDRRAGLEADIRKFFLREEEEWEEEEELLGSDLWDTMPAVDSKAVARTAGIFKEWLGKAPRCPANPARWIRQRGRRDPSPRS